MEHLEHSQTPRARAAPWRRRHLDRLLAWPPPPSRSLTEAASRAVELLPGANGVRSATDPMQLRTTRGRATERPGLAKQPCARRPRRHRVVCAAPALSATATYLPYASTNVVEPVRSSGAPQYGVHTVRRRERSAPASEGVEHEGAPAPPRANRRPNRDASSDAHRSDRRTMPYPCLLPRRRPSHPSPPRTFGPPFPSIAPHR